MKSHHYFAALLFLMAGCATSNDWTRGQGTSAERAALSARKSEDKADCKKMALEEAVKGHICGQAAAADDSIDARATRICIFNNCMQSKGWKDFGTVYPDPTVDVRIVP